MGGWPDVMESMIPDNLLAKATESLNKNIPDKIGNFPINGPDGLYQGYFLTGYVLAYNTRYLALRVCQFCPILL